MKPTPRNYKHIEELNIKPLFIKEFISKNESSSNFSNVIAYIGEYGELGLILNQGSDYHKRFEILNNVIEHPEESIEMLINIRTVLDKLIAKANEITSKYQNDTLKNE